MAFIKANGRRELTQEQFDQLNHQLLTLAQTLP